MTVRKDRRYTVATARLRPDPTRDLKGTITGSMVPPQTPEWICAKVRYPASISVDQGGEFISRKLDLWTYMKAVTLDFSRPGKPTDNAFTEVSTTSSGQNA